MTLTDPIGTFPDPHTIRMEMRYPHPPALVWRAITDPASLAVWVKPMELDVRPGGRGAIVDHGQPKGDPPAEGVVAACEPPSLLEIQFPKGVSTWPESTLRYELT